MIKFRVVVGDNIFVGFGLSEENLKRLREGMPILIKNDEVKKLFGEKCEENIIVMYGRTEKEIQEELAKHLEM